MAKYDPKIVDQAHFSSDIKGFLRGKTMDLYIKDEKWISGKFVKYIDSNEKPDKLILKDNNGTEITYNTKKIGIDGIVIHDLTEREKTALDEMNGYGGGVDLKNPAKQEFSAVLKTEKDPDLKVETRYDVVVWENPGNTYDKRRVDIIKKIRYQYHYNLDGSEFNKDFSDIKDVVASEENAAAKVEVNNRGGGQKAPRQKERQAKPLQENQEKYSQISSLDHLFYFKRINDS